MKSNHNAPGGGLNLLPKYDLNANFPNYMWKNLKFRIKQFETTNQPPTNHQHIYMCLQELGPQTCTKTGGSSPKSFHVTTWANWESKNANFPVPFWDLSRGPLFFDTTSKPFSSLYKGEFFSPWQSSLRACLPTFMVTTKLHKVGMLIRV